jgi:hypothetical protein
MPHDQSHAGIGLLADWLVGKPSRTFGVKRGVAASGMFAGLAPVT